jgi:Flp pilus assembly protein TadD
VRKSRLRKNQLHNRVTGISSRSPSPNTPSRPRFSARLRFLSAILGLTALVLMAYGNSLSNGFVWDDHEQIESNPVLGAQTQLINLFASDVRFANRSSSVVHTEYYRPLQMVTYRVVFDLFGRNAEAFHVCSILLLLCGTFAGFAVAWLLTGKMTPAFVAAGLFAVYPIHTEAVDWIAASPDLGCGLFVLLACVFFLRGRRAAPTENVATQSRHYRWVNPFLSVVAFGVALLWKETAAVFPLIAVAYVLVVDPGSGNRMRSALRASLPYLLVLAVYLGLRVRVLGSFGTGQRNWALTPAQYLLTALHLMASYWAKLAVPFSLNAYDLLSPLRSASDPRAISAILFAVCAIAGLAYLVRQAPLGVFAALWVGITLLPAMDLKALGRNALAERYLYLPSFGFCLLLALSATWLMSRVNVRLRKPVGICLFAVVVAGLMAETVARNPDWKDDSTLFSVTLRRSPQAPFVRYMVATDESTQIGESEMAEQNYLQAIALAKQEVPPDRLDLVMACEGAARLYADRSDYPRALQMLDQAREAAPGDPGTEREEGLILARASRWGEAEPLLEKSLASQPENEEVLSALGLLDWQYHHDLNRAAELFSKALAVHPQEDDFGASLHNNLGGICGQRGDYSCAIGQFRHAVAISPGNPEYHTNLASALGAANRFDEARSEAEAALRIDSTYAAARDVLRNLKVR